jgi:hypothetical protein
MRMRVLQSLGFLALAALPRAALEPMVAQILADHHRPHWLSRLLGMVV